MVDFVDVLVEERNGVHRAVHPVVPGIFEDEENGDLVGHLPDAGEWDGSLEAEVLAHGVEKPNLRELDGEMREEDKECALCLFPVGGDFVLYAVSIRSLSLAEKEQDIPVESCTF